MSKPHHAPEGEPLPITLMVGAPRSGLSLFADILAAHPRLGFISQLQAGQAQDPRPSRRNRLYQLPMVGPQLYARARDGSLRLPRFAFPVPVEPWPLWDAILPELSPRDGDGLWLPLLESEPPLREDRRGQAAPPLLAMLRAQRRQHLLTYYAGHVRARVVAAGIGKVGFLHVVRDGRAVAESWLRNIESGAFRTWEERDSWPLGWPEDWARSFRERHYHPFGLVVFLWKHFVLANRRELAPLGAAGMEVRYEDLVRDADACLRRVLAHAGLDPHPGLRAYLERNPIPDNNGKWRKGLSAAQLASFDSIVTEPELRLLLDPA